MLTEEQILSIIDALKVKTLEQGQENQDLLNFFEEKIQSMISNGIEQKDKLSEEDTQDIISLFPDELFIAKDSEALTNLSSIFQRHATQDTHVKRNTETLKKTEEKLQYLLVECSRNIFLAQAKKESACLALSPEADFKFISLSADPFQFTAFKKSIQNLEKKLSDNSYYKSELEQTLSQCTPSILIVENKETQKKCQKKLRLLMQELLRGSQDILPIIKCLSRENASWLSQLATSEQLTLKEFQKRWLLKQYHPDFDERSELSAFTQHFLDHCVRATTYRAALNIKKSLEGKEILEKVIPGSDIEKGNFKLTCLEVTDPRCYYLGDEVNCCLHAGGIAEQCIIDGITKPTSGFYVVTERKGKAKEKEKICAVIYAFISQKGNLILDSIEPLSAGGKSEYSHIVRDLVMEFATDVVQDNQRRSPIQRVCLGIGGKTGLCFDKDTLTNKALSDGYEETELGTSQYWDSDTVIVLAHSAPEEERLQRLIHTLVGDLEKSRTEDPQRLKTIARELLLTYCSELFYVEEADNIDLYIRKLRLKGFEQSFKKEEADERHGYLNLSFFYKETFAAMLPWVCQNNNIDLIDFFVDKGVSLETTDSSGQTALCVACKNGYTHTVRALLEAGAEINHVSTFGYTPLSLAVSNNHPEIVKVLLAISRIEVNHKNNNGETPLLVAIQKNYKDIEAILLQAGAELSLAEAVNLGLVDNIRSLLANGAHVNIADSHGYTPLSLVTRNGHTEIFKMLIHAGADINIATHDGETPLFFAAENGRIDMVKELLAISKIAVHHKNNNGETPLYYAVQNAHEKIVNILLKADAAVDIVNQYQDTPLSFAARNGHIEIFKILLHAGADINIENNYGETPFSLAVKRLTNTELVKELLNKVVNLDHENYTGETALSWASNYGYIDIVKILLDAGATGNTVNNYGDTPLVLAARRGHTEIVRALLEAGTDINRANKQGDTPLSLAVKRSHIEIAKELLSAGATIDASLRQNTVFQKVMSELKIPDDDTALTQKEVKDSEPQNKELIFSKTHSPSPDHKDDESYQHP